MAEHKGRFAARRGVTIIELMMTLLITLIVGLALGAVIAGAQTGWNEGYQSINGDLITDGYVAKSKFDSVIRNASKDVFLLDTDHAWVEITYYADDTAAEPDRYGRFYTEDGALLYEYGVLSPRETLDVETICENVSACVFDQIGEATHMTLTLDDGRRTNTVISSAVAHNE